MVSNDLEQKIKLKMAKYPHKMAWSQKITDKKNRNKVNLSTVKIPWKFYWLNTMQKYSWLKYHVKQNISG